MKRLIVAIVVCMMAFTFPAFAVSQEHALIEGTWNVTGTASVVGSIPTLLSLHITLLKSQYISDTFVFNSSTLSTQAMGQVGTYTISNTGHVAVDINSVLLSLESELGSELPAGATISFPRHALTMQLIGGNHFAGQFILNIGVDTIIDNTPERAVIKIAFNLKGEKLSGNAAIVNADTDAVKVISEFIRKKAIKPILSRISTN